MTETKQGQGQGLPEFGSKAEAEAWLVETWFEIEDLNLQLKDMNKTGQDGQRMTSEEYWAWRKKVERIRLKKLRAYKKIQAQVKAWPKETVGQEKVVKAGLTLLLDLAEEIEELDMEEVQIVAEVKKFLGRGE